MSTVGGLRVVGVVYGFAGLNFVFPLSYGLIGFAADPDYPDWLFLGELALITIVPASCCFAMMYAFFTLRRWGQRLGVLSNALLYLALVALALRLFIASVEPIELPSAMIFFFLSVLAVPISLLGICLSPSVRNVMTR